MAREAVQHTVDVARQLVKEGNVGKVDVCDYRPQA